MPFIIESLQEYTFGGPEQLVTDVIIKVQTKEQEIIAKYSAEVPQASVDN